MGHWSMISNNYAAIIKGEHGERANCVQSTTAINRYHAHVNKRRHTVHVHIVRVLHCSEQCVQPLQAEC